MNNITDFYSKIDFDALFEISNNPIQYVIKTALKSLQEYFKNGDVIVPKQDIKTLRYVYNICDHVLYEDDKLIKKLWANLLLNTIDSNYDKQIQNIFIHILANLTHESALLLENILSLEGKGIGYQNLLKTDDRWILHSLGLTKEVMWNRGEITPLAKGFYSAISRNQK